MILSPTCLTVDEVFFGISTPSIVFVIKAKWVNFLNTLSSPEPVNQKKVNSYQDVKE